MLARLVIQDVVLIDRLTVALGPGLNVFTGETGAGKSILLDALGLALGARAEAGLVRAGVPQASVTAVFEGPVPPALAALAATQGLALEEPLLLRRVLGRDGKSRAFVNDQPVGVALLREMGAALLEMHGQFDTQGLLDSRTHRGLLDAFAGLEKARAAVAAAWETWSEARAALREQEDAEARARETEGFLKASVEELDALAPQPDEAGTLAERRAALQHRDRVRAGLQAAQDALGGDRGALAQLAAAGKAVARVADKDPALPDLLARIDRATAEAAEAEEALARFLDADDDAPAVLLRIEERLFALRAAARKHGAGVERLPEIHAALRSRLAALEESGDRRMARTRAEAQARAAYETAATALGAARRAAAPKLAARVLKELPPLHLERARFVVEVVTLSPDDWGPEGQERVVFLAAANPGTEPGALGKVASGGEMARFMLALKVALAAVAPVPTLVFDEVDAGIGGATASAVGERLAALAESVQVLVVTHSPQVAARGAHHARVLKTTGARAATTEVAVLRPAERIEEIARMLAGTRVTDAARQAALSLLEERGQEEPKAAPRARRAGAR